MDETDYDESYQEYLKLREKLKRPKNNIEHSILTSENPDIEQIEYHKPVLYNPEDDEEIDQYILEKRGEYIKEYQRMINQEVVKEKDKIICFHRESLNMIRGTFVELEDRENVGIVLNYKGQFGGREALLLKDYILYYKTYQPYVYKSKFRKQLESLLQISSIRVKKKKKSNEEMIIQPDDLMEKIDEVESNDLFENIDDDS